MSWEQIGGLAFAGLVLSLVTGKTLKRILSYCLEWLSSKWKNRKVDALVDSVQEDWGIDHKETESLINSREGKEDGKE